MRKIFLSYDFQNNKVQNAKLSSEINHDEHIVNKKYVDDSFIYSTELSQLYDDSIAISRMVGNDNKSISELFDELLYGVIHPEYFEPELLVCVVVVTNPIPESFNKFVFGVNNHIYVRIQTINNDRNYLEDPKLVVNGVECTMTDKIDNKIWFFKTQVLTQMPNSVVFTQKFGPYQGASKLDNRGEGYVDPNFQQNKTISIDFTQDINKRLLTWQPVLISKKRVSEGNPDFSDILEFSKFAFVFSDGTTEEIRDILIPTRFFDGNSLKYVLRLNENNYTTGVCNINKLGQYTGLQEVTIDGVNYFKAQYNFGYCYPDSNMINGIGLYT